jgi:translation initiation factor IF-2
MPGEKKRSLEIVLKCDSVGSSEAVVSSITSMQDLAVGISIIHSGIGSINKSDLLMANTGSKLVAGFNVDLLPKIQQLSKEQGIEIRLYDIIYKLTDDLKKTAESLIPRGVREKITGNAKVIELFKSSRKGIILGCEVRKGTLALGKKFRVISAMGPVYSGKIESLHIQRDTIKEAKAGQQVGLKISDFNKAKVGDQVECYETVKQEGPLPWQPKGGVFVIT